MEAANAATLSDTSRPAAAAITTLVGSSQAQISGDLVAPTTEQSSAPKKRGRKRKSTAADGDAAEEQTGADGSVAAPPPKRRVRKKKTRETAVGDVPNGQAADTTQPMPASTQSQINPEASDGNEAEGTLARKRGARARSVTPDDAEGRTVDPQKLRMADLTKDLHIGKKFSRHDELKERERQRRRNLRVNGETVSGEDGSRAGTPAQATQSSTPAAQTQQGLETPAVASGPQFHIVDGQIVVDQSSLVVDRHARAAAATAGQEMEEVEENDFTRLTTSASYATGSKLRGPNHWSDEATEKFYRGLRMFGTDFETISKMFPGKQRRHVKMKFNREERVSPGRVTAALVGEKKVKIDLVEFASHTGEELQSMEAINAELAQNESSWNEKYEAARKAHEEEMQRKKDELFRDDESAAPERNAGAGPGAGRGKKVSTNRSRGRRAGQAT